MSSLRRQVLLPVVLLVMIAGACGSATGSTAVSVGGVDYSESALRDDLADVIDGGTAPASDTTLWLNEWIFFTTIGLELEKRGVMPTGDQIDQAVELLRSQDPAFDPEAPGSDVRIEQWAIRVAAVEWTHSEYPDAPPVEIDTDVVPNMLCSNHILVETEEQARDVLARLEAGEDFGELAIELSIDEGSGAAGGELGCWAEGSLVPEFEAAGYAATDGEVVGPVQSAFGFHVIEVTSAGPATAEEHPDVDPEVIESTIATAEAGARADAQAAAQADVQTLRDTLLEELRQAAFVDYADSVSVASEYGTWDPELFAVLAPGESAPAPAG